MRGTQRPLWVRLGMTAAVLALTTGAVGASAAEAETKHAGNGASTVEAAGKPFVVQARSGSGMLLHDDVHQRHYWKLLAAAYAPELSDEWQAALDERKKVEDGFPKAEAGVLKLEERVVPSPNGPAAALPDAVLPAIPGDAAVRAIATDERKLEIATSEDGLVMRIRLGGMSASELGSLAAEAGSAATGVKPSEEMQRQMDLRAAVEAGDEAAIRELLPKLLDDYRKQTEALKAHLEELKAQQAGNVE